MDKQVNKYSIRQCLYKPRVQVRR